MRAMDEIEEVYEALNEVERELADDLMARLLNRLASCPSGER
jgi:hypothetical protein